MADPKAKQQEQEAVKKLREAYEAVAETDEGRLVLRHIAGLCRHNTSARILNPETNEVNLISTALNVERNKVWFEIRPWISAKMRIKIEN